MSLLDAANFPHTATAKRRKRSRDASGGTKDSYPTTEFTDRPCWRQGASDSEITMFAKKGIIVSNKIYFATDPGLDERHILIIGGAVYNVVSAADPDASVGLGILWRVMVDQKSPEAPPI